MPFEINGTASFLGFGILFDRTEIGILRYIELHFILIWGERFWFIYCAVFWKAFALLEVGKAGCYFAIFC